MGPPEVGLAFYESENQRRLFEIGEGRLGSWSLMVGGEACDKKSVRYKRSMVTEALKSIVEQVLRDTMPGLMRQMLEEALKSVAFTVADEGYMTTAEAAKWVRVDPSTIRRWLAEGHLKRYNAGREMRVSKSELRDFLGRRGRGLESASADDIVNQIVKSL